MIDTHCHLFLQQFDKDLDEVLQRAADRGVEAILMPAIDFDSLKAMESITHPDIELYRMAGVHPCEIEGPREGVREQLTEWISRDDIYAVGETGLDYYWSTDYKKEQQESLHIHCEVAKELDKPIVLHNRESTDDLLDIIEKHQDGSLTGVWHSFTGSVDEGKKALDLGLMLGIGGIMTFKNAGVDKAVAQLPLDKMMIETDAPYLAPTPKRGKRNEPAFVYHTAKRLAEVQDTSFEEVVEVTTRNAKELFNLPK